MGDLIMLDAVRARRNSASEAPAMAATVAFGSAALTPAARLRTDVPGLSAPIKQFYFDLSCPFSYLAAERVERLLGQVEWIPVTGKGVCGTALPGWEQAAAAEARAEALRLPLSWPEAAEGGFPTALRATAYASRNKAGGRFALAAMRLAFCGGYDLEDPGVLAEAAAAAGLGFDGVVAASQDPSWDSALAASASELARAHISRLPAFRVGGRWFEGEQGLVEAVSLLRQGLAVPA
jgi:2-hydroxychromene-2-carboxylate isomerase